MHIYARRQYTHTQCIDSLSHFPMAETFIFVLRQPGPWGDRPIWFGHAGQRKEVMLPVAVWSVRFQVHLPSDIHLHGWGGTGIFIIVFNFIKKIS